jgi:ABC-type tungstate transport system permease subunit
VGTWVLNVSKSTFDPPPPLKSSTVTVTPVQGGGVHTVLDIVEADGTSQHVEYTTALDGKAAPMTGYPDADSIIVTQINSRTIKDVFLKAGKSVERGTFTVSKDGKTMRGPLSGTEGEVHWKYHYVFDRQ